MGNNKQTIFQIILLSIFGLIAVGSVLVLANYNARSTKSAPVVPVTIWGPTFGAINPNLMVRELADKDARFQKVTYVEKHPQTLYSEVLEAIATGRGPDMVILDQQSLLPLKNKLQVIPYERYPLRDFKDRFIESTEVFAQPEGIYAFPIAVDPLILFWNRNLFTNAVVAQVPTNWDSFVRLVPRLSVIERGADLRQSAIAFGEYENVMHAKEILSALMFQLNNPIVGISNGRYVSKLTVPDGESRLDPVRAVSFYTDFANPVKGVYSWNKTFARSREAFSSNKVAMYAGFASEIPILYKINPNLNFDIAVWPQSTVSTNQATYARVYGIAILATSAKKERAFTVIQALTEYNSALKWGSLTQLPSARRDILSTTPPNDPYAEIIARSAIISRTWPEPSGGGRTDEVFRTLINDIVSGKKSVSSALSTAHADINALLAEYN
jgi:ABC-type glycerol-3-phosphate transport system substrate-binding protein